MPTPSNGGAASWIEDTLPMCKPVYHGPHGRGHRGENRVYRGGSWNSNARNVRAAYRNFNDPANRWNDQGFRLARAQRRTGGSATDPAAVRSAHMDRSVGGEYAFGRRCAGRVVDATAKAHRRPDSQSDGR